MWGMGTGQTKAWREEIVAEGSETSLERKNVFDLGRVLNAWQRFCVFSWVSLSRRIA